MTGTFTCAVLKNNKMNEWIEQDKKKSISMFASISPLEEENQLVWREVEKQGPARVIENAFLENLICFF